MKTGNTGEGIGMRGSAVVMVKCLILCRLLLIFAQDAAMHRTGI